jgi:hypothetical protein
MKIWLEAQRNRCLLLRVGDGLTALNITMNSTVLLLPDETAAAEQFAAFFKASVVDGSHILRQMFNLDRIGHSWKCMPDCTFISIKVKMRPGFKAAKDSCMLMF